MVKDFDGWNDLKKVLESQNSPLVGFRKINNKKRKFYKFKEGEIWFCSVGANIGTEICGKNKYFDRPVLILRKSGRSFICLPLTSKKSTNKNFQFDNSYEWNNCVTRSFVYFASPKCFDILRLRRRIKRLSDDDFIRIRNLSKEFYSGGF